MSERCALPLTPVQHHHAHIASCMAETAVALNAGPVIGLVFDGLGYGADATLWGGEFLLADYRGYRRLAHLAPVAMPGGVQAIRQPWRNTYAHLCAALGWERFMADYGATALFAFLADRPRATLDGMIARGINAPLASSCGRLFDAVAAAIGICRDRAQYEGQAALELEAAVDEDALALEDDALAYPFGITRPAPQGPLCLDPAPMWRALLDDIAARVTIGVIAARFHRGLAIAAVRMVAAVRRYDPEAANATRIALSGGVFQNRILLEQLVARLPVLGLEVLMHREVPANDGGLALGQAVIAAATARD